MFHSTCSVTKFRHSDGSPDMALWAPHLVTGDVPYTRGLPRAIARPIGWREGVFGGMIAPQGSTPIIQSAGGKGEVVHVVTLLLFVRVAFASCVEHGLCQCFGNIVCEFRKASDARDVLEDRKRLESAGWCFGRIEIDLVSWFDACFRNEQNKTFEEINVLFGGRDRETSL